MGWADWLAMAVVVGGCLVLAWLVLFRLPVALAGAWL